MYIYMFKMPEYIHICVCTPSETISHNIISHFNFSVTNKSSSLHSKTQLKSGVDEDNTEDIREKEILNLVVCCYCLVFVLFTLLY